MRLSSCSRCKNQRTFGRVFGDDKTMKVLITMIASKNGLGFRDQGLSPSSLLGSAGQQEKIPLAGKRKVKKN